MLQTNVHSEHSFKKKCGQLRKRTSRPHRVQGKPKRRQQDQRSFTTQGKDIIDKTTRTTGHVPTEYIRPATIHQKQPPRLHLTVKRKTTFNVQPLRKGIVDHKRLRSGDHRFPLRHWKVFTKTFEFHIFFSSVCGWCRHRGIMLDDFRIETLH